MNLLTMSIEKPVDSTTIPLVECQSQSVSVSATATGTRIVEGIVAGVDTTTTNTNTKAKVNSVTPENEVTLLHETMAKLSYLTTGHTTGHTNSNTNSTSSSTNTPNTPNTPNEKSNQLIMVTEYELLKLSSECWLPQPIVNVERILGLNEKWRCLKYDGGDNNSNTNNKPINTTTNTTTSTAASATRDVISRIYILFQNCYGDGISDYYNISKPAVELQWDEKLRCVHIAQNRLYMPKLSIYGVTACYLLKTIVPIVLKLKFKRDMTLHLQLQVAIILMIQPPIPVPIPIHNPIDTSIPVLLLCQCVY